MKKMLFALAFISVMSACTNESEARHALEAAGYTDIVLTGYDPFSCSDNDAFSTGFRAKGPTGVPVEGVVCCGFLKGSTIRLK